VSLARQPQRVGAGATAHVENPRRRPGQDAGQHLLRPLELELERPARQPVLLGIAVVEARTSAGKSGGIMIARDTRQRRLSVLSYHHRAGTTPRIDDTTSIAIGGGNQTPSMGQERVPHRAASFETRSGVSTQSQCQRLDADGRHPHSGHRIPLSRSSSSSSSVTSTMSGRRPDRLSAVAMSWRGRPPPSC